MVIMMYETLVIAEFGKTWIIGTINDAFFVYFHVEHITLIL